MENQMTQAGSNLPAKGDLRSFVHDVAELETAIFTLDKTVEEAKKKRKTERGTYQTRVQDAKQKRVGLEQELKSVDQKRKEKMKYETGISKGEFLGGVVGGGLIAFIGLFIAVFIIAFIVTGFFYESRIDDFDFFMKRDAIIALIGAGVGTIGVIIFLVIFYVKEERASREAHETEIAKIEHAQKYYKNRIETAKGDIAKAELSLRQFDAATQSFMQNLALIESRRRELEMRLKQMYDLGIIPPDYRTMDCVLMLDQIFRNDLADTMREAVKLYEDRVFRGEVIQGIHKIYDMLGQLTSHMAQIGRTLEDVRSRVSLMSDDLCTLVSRSEAMLAQRERMIEKQDKILEESKLNRYATEAVAKSNERLAYYAQKWDTVGKTGY